jgi:hypothetical protein
LRHGPSVAGPSDVGCHAEARLHCLVDVVDDRERGSVRSAGTDDSLAISGWWRASPLCRQPCAPARRGSAPPLPGSGVRYASPVRVSGQLSPGTGCAGGTRLRRPRRDARVGQRGRMTSRPQSSPRTSTWPSAPSRRSLRDRGLSPVGICNLPVTYPVPYPPRSTLAPGTHFDPNLLACR